MDQLTGQVHQVYLQYLMVVEGDIGCLKTQSSSTLHKPRSDELPESTILIHYRCRFMQLKQFKCRLKYWKNGKRQALPASIRL